MVMVMKYSRKHKTSPQSTEKRLQVLRDVQRGRLSQQSRVQIYDVSYQAIGDTPSLLKSFLRQLGPAWTCYTTL